MAVTITQTPESYELSKNQAVFSLSSDIYPQQAGADNIIVFNPVESPADGDTMLWSFYVDGALIEAKFLFKDAPNTSGFQAPAHNSGTMAEYIENELFPAVVGHPIISSYYEVYFDGTIGNGVIGLRSFTQQSHNLQMVVNGFTYQFISVPGEEFTALDDYSIKYRVAISESSQESPLTFSKYHTTIPNSSGVAKIDVAPILHDLITELDPITEVLTGYLLNTKTLRYYFIEATEQWVVNTGSETIVKQNVVRRSTRHQIIKGAEPIRLWSKSLFINRASRWLGLMGEERYLAFNSKATASIKLAGGSNLPLTLIVQILDLNGTQTTVNAIESQPGETYSENEIVSIPIGYEALGLESSVAINLVVSYKCFVLLGSVLTPFSITIYPEVAKAFHTELRYRDAHGVCQTLMLKGSKTETAQLEKEILETAREVSMNQSSRSNTVINKAGADTITLESAALPASYENAMWELIHSAEHYLMVEDVAVPVTILNKEVTKSKLNRQADHTLKITLELAFNSDRT